MPKAHPPQFRRRAVELARAGGKPQSELARDPGISASCLRTWVAQADKDEGRRQGATSEQRGAA
jgi:transposase-like protein